MKWACSFAEFLLTPSAIFDGTDVTALRNCDAKPNFSLSGNCSINLYTGMTKSLACWYAFNFSNRNIAVVLMR